jgi:hypothetical protein
VYKGRPATIDLAKVREMKAQAMGASAISKALGIHRASVYQHFMSAHVGGYRGGRQLVPYRRVAVRAVRSGCCRRHESNGLGGRKDCTLSGTIMGKKPSDKRWSSFDVEAWLTQPDQSTLCAKQPGYLPVSPPDAERPIIRVNPARRHQVMDGFGFALTGGSADLIAQLPSATRDALFRELFLTDNDGIGITYLRISIGASDLSSKAFSYDDVSEGEADPGLERFNLEAGDVQLIPILKQILAINPDIRLIATPWSAPPWMKSNQSFVGGALTHEYYQVYAKYIVTYINRFKYNGIIISAITTQNEPLNKQIIRAWG